MGTTRYPGIYFFSAEQKDLFFGRDADIKKMLTLVHVEKYLLLYSKSGIGKTSLLHAGVIPNFPEYMKPIVVRFYQNTSSDVSPLKRVTAYVKINFRDEKSVKNYLFDKLIKLDSANELWYLFKKIQLSYKNESRTTFVFIFDQFEEFFSYSDNEIDEFIIIIKSLINNSLPANSMSIISDLISSDDKITPEIISQLNTPLNVKIIFSIRSDRLNFLNRISKKLPDILNIYHELKPLSINQARTAIAAPAKVQGDYKSDNFRFTDDAVEKIISFLSKNGTFDVETTHLQIICQRIEQKIIENKTFVKNEVSARDIPDLKNIFKDFFDNAIDALPEEIKSKAMLMIEQEFVAYGQRTSVDEKKCLKYVEAVYLKILVDKYLLRAVQNNMGGFNFELAHDTLIAPIQELAEKRKIEEQKHEAELKLQEELRKAKIKEEQQKIENLKQRKRNIIVFMALLIAIVFGFVAFISWQKEKDLLIKLKTEQFNRSVNDAEAFKKIGDYSTAIQKLELADSLGVNDSLVSVMLNEYNAKFDLKPKYDSLVTLGDTNYNSGNYISAYKYYKKALDLDVYNNGVIGKIGNTIKNGTDYYLSKVRGVSVYSSQRVLDEIKSNLKDAYYLSPENDEVKRLYRDYFNEDIDTLNLSNVNN